MARLPKLAALSRKLHAAAPAAVNREMAWAAARMRQLTDDVSGDLDRSIAVVPAAARDGVVAGAVVADSPHAAAVEFGTSRMAAEPFMRPTARELAERFPSDVARDLRRTLK